MINDLFKKIEGRAALISFISCGDPSLAFTKKLIKRVCAAGADIIELGVPFSDPMADGAVIQSASNRALAGGVNILKIFQMVKELRDEGVKTKFVLFSYLNPLFSIELSRAAQLSSDSGIDAWLVVDVPIEECGEVKVHTDKYGIDFIPLAAATTPLERVKKISESGSGFLYYVTVTGVTGVRNALAENFAKRLEEVKAASCLPVAAGFGISNEQMAHEAACAADAVVVGSALVKLVNQTLLSSGEEAALQAAEEFISSFAKQMRR